MTVDEVAKRVKRDARTVRRWCSEPKGRLYNIALRDQEGAWRVPEEWVVQYEKEHPPATITPMSVMGMPADNALVLLDGFLAEYRKDREDDRAEMAELRREVQELRAMLAERHVDARRRDEQTDAAITEWRELKEALKASKRPWWRFGR